MKTNSPISFDIALTNKDLKQIVGLRQSLSPPRVKAGIVAEHAGNVQHDLSVLRSMNASAKQVIARLDERVVGYALAIRPEIRHLVPTLTPMFDMLDKLYYKGVPLPETHYYIVGQVCIGEEFKGEGIFRGLYAKHKEVFSSEYDLCLTEVATRNLKVMRAHTKIGFKTIHTYRDSGKEWNILLWDWNGVSQD